ncbi:MAG: hypothetical protein HY681_15125 [Chloroflexi bacterium]|nr:hypothetical protein [Chloroflexota bacterium]
MTTHMDHFRQRREQLLAEIAQIERQIAPLVKQLSHKKELLKALENLIDLETNPKSEPIGSTPSSQKVKWAQICREHGWPVGGNSAHRIVMGRDPKLHASIPHSCEYT